MRPNLMRRVREAPGIVALPPWGIASHEVMRIVLQYGIAKYYWRFCGETADRGADACSYSPQGGSWGHPFLRGG